MIRCAFLLLAVPFYFTASLAMAQLPAQQNPNLEIRSGTIKEIIKKGKARTLVVTTGGEDLSFPLTPKIQLLIEFTGGTEAAIQSGAYIEGSGIQSVKNLILDNAKIYLIDSSVRTPPAQVKTPEQKVIGQSENLRVITGQIVNRQPSTNYEGYEELTFRATGDFPTILFKKNLKVDLVSTQIDDAELGLPIVLELLPGRGNKKTLVKATIEGGAYTPKETPAKK